MVNNDIFDIIILGGGPAGLTAAIYTSRAQLKTLIVAGQPSGGQLMNTTEVENFPGFPEGILGPQLIQNMRDQATRFGTSMVEENVISISGTAEESFMVTTDAGKVYKGKVIILAMGASAKWLGLESEDKLKGRGVSACATCDGYFFKDKAVAVIGGGDAAMEEATYLTRFASKVYLLVRGPQEEMRASKIMQQRALNDPKIQFLFNTEVLEVLGENTMEGLKVVNKLNQVTTVLEDAKGLFVAIGHRPNTAFLKDFIELGKVGYINVYEQTRTSKEGVFVAGDVADFRYRQAISAAGMGCMAALDAEKYLAEKEAITG
jgi:thioredoxin reductase (NADPH)